MANYFLLFTAAIIGIVVLDEDPTSVSIQEWVLFAVMIYAAVAFFRRYREQISRENKR
jgi:Ca2+/Na+ antiporter